MNKPSQVYLIAHGKRTFPIMAPTAFEAAYKFAKQTGVTSTLHRSQITLMGAPLGWSFAAY